MRTEDEMHDLVVAKVAAHRRRRALLASAGGGVAVVLLLVAVAAGASGSAPDDSVHAGEGEPTSTTEAPTTTTEPSEDTTSTTTVAPPPETDPAPTPTTAAPPTTTEPPPTTSTTEPPPTTSTTEAPAGPTSAVVTGSDGDLRVSFTVSTNHMKGWVTVRVQIEDPTGVHATDGWSNGPWGVVSRDAPEGTHGDVAYYGDTVAGCGDLSGEPAGVEPGSFDKTITMTPGSGPLRLRLFAATLTCMDGENAVELFHDVVIP